jgi:hypothetical protein
MRSPCCLCLCIPPFQLFWMAKPIFMKLGLYIMAPEPNSTAPGSHWIGGWVDPRAGLADMEKWKFLTPPGLNSDPSVVQPVASRYTDWAIPAPPTDNISFANVAKFKYFGTTRINWNCICEEMRRWLNCEKACCHPVQNLSSSHLPSNSVILKYTQL